MLPLFVRRLETRGRKPSARQFADWTYALFFATALARAAGKYPARANDLAAAADAAAPPPPPPPPPTPTPPAPPPTPPHAAAPRRRRYAARAAAAAADAAYAAARLAAAAADARSQLWGALSDDVARLQTGGVAEVIDAPLWPEGNLPDWVRERWPALRNALSKSRGGAKRAPSTSTPKDDWQVWFAWYEERLAGGSRGEEWEMTFATVPEPVWKKGAAEGNAWIAERLKALGEKPLLPAETADRPPPVDGAVSPVAYDWVAPPESETQRRIAEVGGAHNFPLYSNAASEQDHQVQLALCRRNAEWLAKEIERTRKTNAIPRDYEPALREYLDVLPAASRRGQRRARL